MANVYISFLGTNNYLPCHYVADDFVTPEPIRFVQEATIQYRCANWSEKDRILIFTTEEAQKCNWQDGGHCDRKTNTPHEGLQTRLQRLGLKAPFRAIPIAPGYKTEQIWQQFNTVFEALEEGDQVIFDITHAFRSIPMLALVVIHYARIFKSIAVGGIYYGAFEALGPQWQVDKIPTNERKAPIVDLTPLAELLDWSVATDRFLKGGDTALMGDLAQKSVAPLLKASKGANKDAQAVKKLGNILKRMSLALSTCRGLEISEVAKNLKEQVAACTQSDLLPPFAKLFDRIQQRLQGFSGNPIVDGLAAVRWCCEHGLIQQGYTLLEELLFSAVLLETGYDIQNLEHREIASQAFFIIGNHLDQTPDQWVLPSKDHPDMTRRIIDVIRSKGDLYKKCSQIREFRNDLNHAGHNPSARTLKSAGRFADDLKQLISDVERTLVP
jgi:CRISPR-associated Csx2 family protein